jgi:lysosomal acid phosphatase
MEHINQTCTTLLHSVLSNTAVDMQLIIVLQEAGGLMLPEWTQTVYPEKMKSMAAISLMLFTYTDVLKRLTGGECYN